MDKVLIAPAPLSGVQAEFLNVLKKAGFELVFPKKKAQMVEDELLEQLAGIKATLAGSEPYTRKVLQAHPQLRVIARAGVGYDAVDTGRGQRPRRGRHHRAGHQSGRRRRAHLYADPRHRQEPGAAASRHLRTQVAARANLPLRGRTLGIAGLGRIGKAVALRGECFG